METIVDWVLHNPYWAALGSIVGVLGFFISIIMGAVQRKRKSISFTRDTTVLIKNTKPEIEGLEITYQGKPVSSIYITKIHLWNSGNTLIKRQDFYPDKEIRVEMKESSVQVLSARIEKESADTCKVSINIDEKEAVLKMDFEYLEKKQGAVISIYHTKSEDVKVSGKLIEGKLRDRTATSELIDSAIVSYTGTTMFQITYNSIELIAGAIYKGLKKVAGAFYKQETKD